MCSGGTYNENDSNEPPLYVTEEECLVDGGGTSYDAYTCAGIEDWLQFDAILLGLTNEVMESMKKTWWQPTCCREVVEGVSIGDEDEDDEDDEDTATVTVTAVEEESSSSTYSWAYGSVIIVASFVITVMAL